MEYNYSYTDEEYREAFNKIYYELLSVNPQKGRKCACFLGGQPGAGKSSYYKTHKKELEGYAIIDGDEFRSYHPRFDEIMKYAPEEYAEEHKTF